MAFIFSPLTDDESTPKTPKISLAGAAHIKMYRIWMFAMLKDQPNRTEREHITECEPCGRAFGAALGVSSFGKASKGQQPPANETPVSSDRDEPKAVA
jgi:hypothetical protein